MDTKRFLSLSRQHWPQVRTHGDPVRVHLSETATLIKAEALGWLRAQFDLHGAPIVARMTGTGACIFAAFERAEEAERIAARVPDRWDSFVARGLNRSPLHAMLRLHG